MAPLVRKACEEHGVSYRTAPWGKVLKDALSWISELSKKTPTTAALVSASVAEMT